MGHCSLVTLFIIFSKALKISLIWGPYTELKVPLNVLDNVVDDVASYTHLELRDVAW